MPIVVPIVVLIICLRPVCYVRFGYFYGNRIAHFVFDTAAYLAGIATLGEQRKSFDYFFYTSDPCNSFWQVYLRRYVRVSWIIESFYSVAEKLPTGERHLIKPFRDTHGYGFPKDDFEVDEVKWELFRKNYGFTEEETIQGRNFLREIGVNEPEKLVCLNVRDKAYLDEAIPRKGGWGFHSYRDSDIRDYELVSRQLSESGYFVLRMGKTVQDKFICDSCNVFDYANSKYRSDFLDIWLAANCAFMISTGSGLDSVAITFGRPVAFVNALPLIDINYWARCVWSPKHLFWEDGGTRLSVSEHLRNGFRNSEYYKSSEIVIGNLSAEEIADTVFELVRFISEVGCEDPIDLRRQKAFWELFFSQTCFRRPTAGNSTDCLVSSAFLKSTVLE